MIPLEFLSKMGIYDVEFNGSHVKTRVVADSRMVEIALKELRASISPSTRLVGIDLLPLKASTIFLGLTNVIILQAGSFCVIFLLRDTIRIWPEALDTFLSDQTLCFVGLETIDHIMYLTKNYDHVKKCIKTVRLAELVGRILKKPSTWNSINLEEIAKEIGHGVEVPCCPSGLKIIDSKLVYSPEEVKVMMRNAYACYLFASKLFGILSEVTGPVRKRPKLEKI